MGNLAEGHIKKEESRHEEKDPHPTGFRTSLDPQPHGHESHGKKGGHEDDRKIVVRAANYLDFRDCESPINSA